MTAKKRHVQTGSRIFDFINIVILLSILLITIYPFWYCIIVSFNDAVNLLKAPLHIAPRKFSMENYKFVFSNPQIGLAFINSILRTVIGTALHCVITGIAAFGLSKKHLFGRRIYLAIFIITMYFSGGMIPTYLLIRGLGLYNNFLVYLIPSMFSFFHAILFMAFYETIPDSLEESAKIDGASVLQIFFRIILPVSLAIFATIALFEGVWHWNQWYDTMIYTKSPNLATLQSILTRLLREVESKKQMQKVMGIAGGAGMKISPMTIRVAMMVVTTFPIVVIYPFFQKYFVKGIMLGSVKG